MTIKEGLKLPRDKYGRVEIPDVGRRQLPEFFREMGYKVGAEIGVQRGYFTKRFCDAGLEMFAVDPWRAYGDYTVGTTWGYQKHQDEVYEACKKYLGDHLEAPNRLCHLVRKTSMEAVNDFEDESLDFVYIDGHHGFKYVTEDIYEWSRKVKNGGVISGHDYAYAPPRTQDNRAYVLQVKYVVDAYTQAFGVNQFYILGAKKKSKDDEKRDQYRSWFWFKGTENKGIVNEIDHLLH